MVMNSDYGYRLARRREQHQMANGDNDIARKILVALFILFVAGASGVGLKHILSAGHSASLMHESTDDLLIIQMQATLEMVRVELSKNTATLSGLKATIDARLPDNAGR